MHDLDKILEERGQTHGDYSEQAEISQKIKRAILSGSSYHTCTAIQRETLHMIAHKMARIVAGNPNVLDHWDDIQGYCKITTDRMRKSVEGEE